MPRKRFQPEAIIGKLRHADVLHSLMGRSSASCPPARCGFTPDKKLDAPRHQA